MPQSLASIHIHLVFSTKQRHPWIDDSIRDSLHRYMGTVLTTIGCPAVRINSVADHAHILFSLSRTATISQVVEEVKKHSSKWIKTQGENYATFAWQAGYGAFAISESNVQAVTDYIAHQQEHHRTTTFQNEYREFLAKHRIPFDEQYVWH